MAFKAPWHRLRDWWNEPSPEVIHLKTLDDGGMQFIPERGYPAPRERFEAAINKPLIKWALGGIGAIIVAAMLKALGLS
jgi:hypothetical protein